MAIIRASPVTRGLHYVRPPARVSPHIPAERARTPASEHVRSPHHYRSCSCVHVPPSHSLSASYLLAAHMTRSRMARLRTTRSSAVRASDPQASAIAPTRNLRTFAHYFRALCRSQRHDRGPQLVQQCSYGAVSRQDATRRHLRAAQACGNVAGSVCKRRSRMRARRQEGTSRIKHESSLLFARARTSRRRRAQDTKVVPSAPRWRGQLYSYNSYFEGEGRGHYRRSTFGSRLLLPYHFLPDAVVDQCPTASSPAENAPAA